MHRHYSAIDKFLVEVDKGIRTVYARPCGSGRANPAGEVTEDTDALSNSDRELAARLMRINHAGEVSAQGLYQGQALTARSQIVRNQMNKSATEENDHLVWCDQRLQELGGQKSHLGPMWYMGSFCIGALAGLVGDRWSLGFVKETEHQVVKHLDDHLEKLPPSDKRSQAILAQMRIDEAHHGHVALSAGAAELPKPFKKLMRLMSRVMTRSAYWI